MVLSLFSMLVEFSNLYIPPCMGKNFQFMVFTFPGNAFNLCTFTHALKLQAGFFKNLFYQNKRGGENYDLLYHNSIKRNKDDLEN